MSTAINSREPQAPQAALPELPESLRPLHVLFFHSEGRQSQELYLSGLLTEHPNKNCDTNAAVDPDTIQQRSHHLLSGCAFDEDDLNDQRVRTLLQSFPVCGKNSSTANGCSCAAVLVCLFPLGTSVGEVPCP